MDAAPQVQKPARQWGAHVVRGLSHMLDFVLPPTCAGCQARVASHAGVCSECWSSLHFLTEPLCPTLGTPLEPGLDEGAVSAAAIAQPPSFARARAAVVHEGSGAWMVAGFKYHDRGDFAPVIARLMLQAGGALLADADMVVPIPLHWRRLFGRKFNQSADLARHICDATHLPYAPDVLFRKKATRQQVRLQAAQRALNVAGAFAVRPESKPRLAGRRVLLIDDVFTTGATVNAAARVLKRSGASNVDVLTFARVIQSD